MIWTKKSLMTALSQLEGLDQDIPVLFECDMGEGVLEFIETHDFQLKINHFDGKINITAYMPEGR